MWLRHYDYYEPVTVRSQNLECRMSAFAGKQTFITVISITEVIESQAILQTKCISSYQYNAYTVPTYVIC